MVWRTNTGCSQDLQPINQAYVQSHLCTPICQNYVAHSEATCTLQDGAACCIIASEDFVHAHKLENQAIEIVAQALTTDGTSTFESRSAMDVVGYTMSKMCADQVFAQAGFKDGEGRDQVGVIELHDCFAANEVGSNHLRWHADEFEHS
jgi:acetyl-CoA acetyltransferase